MVAQATNACDKSFPLEPSSLPSFLCNSKQRSCLDVSAQPRVEAINAFRGKRALQEYKLYRISAYSTNGVEVIGYGPYLEESVLSLQFLLYSKPKDKSSFGYKFPVPDERASWNFGELIRVLLVDFIQTVVVTLYQWGQFVSCTTDLAQGPTCCWGVKQKPIGTFGVYSMNLANPKRFRHVVDVPG